MMDTAVGTGLFFILDDRIYVADSGPPVRVPLHLGRLGRGGDMNPAVLALLRLTRAAGKAVALEALLLVHLGRSRTACGRWTGRAACERSRTSMDLRRSGVSETFMVVPERMSS